MNWRPIMCPQEAEDLIVADFQSGERLTAEEVGKRISDTRTEIEEADQLADQFLTDLRETSPTNAQQRRAVLRLLELLFIEWSPDEQAAIIEQLHQAVEIEQIAA